jgi:uncharacterized protein
VLTDVFERAQSRLGRRAPTLRREQDAWLALRESCARRNRDDPGALADCIGRIYETRIAELSGIAEAGTTASVPQAPDAAIPSFDCRYASSPVERAICTRPRLAALDREMVALFGEARGRISGRERALEADQSEWRGDRDSCARRDLDMETCVEEAYRSRIRELRGIVAGR